MKIKYVIRPSQKIAFDSKKAYEAIKKANEIYDGKLSNAKVTEIYNLVLKALEL